MTAPNIISFRPAPSAGRAGFTGSPRPRAEIYSPWGMVPEHAPAAVDAAARLDMQREDAA